MRARRGRAFAIVGLIAAICVVAVIAAGRAHRSQLRAWHITSASMEPTLRLGATVYTRPGPLQVRVGDIVIFHPPVGALRGNGVCAVAVPADEMCPAPMGGPSGQFWVKRAAAIGGDVLTLFAGRVVLDGRQESEPFALTSSCVASQYCNYAKPVAVPLGDVFLLGDNRANSDDSRFWGPVPLSWIVGVAESCSRSLKHCHVLS